jgi:hypothetical protein
LRLWNEFVSEAMMTGALARSLRFSGRRQDAIKWYRRAGEISALDPALLSEFLCLVLEEEGVPGLLRELPAYGKERVTSDVRQNATLSCFNSWVFLAGGDEKVAFEYLVQAVPYVLQAGQQPAFGGDEGLACGVMLQIVSEKLGDSKRLAVAKDFLKPYPADRVRTMREIFLIPKLR